MYLRRSNLGFTYFNFLGYNLYSLYNLYNQWSVSQLQRLGPTDRTQGIPGSVVYKGILSLFPWAFQQVAAFLLRMTKKISENPIPGVQKWNVCFGGKFPSKSDLVFLFQATETPSIAFHYCSYKTTLQNSCCN